MSPAERAWRWAERHGERLDETLVAADESEAWNLSWLARSFRRQLGQLTGPDLRAGPLVLAPGDQVMVATQPPPDGPELPDVGVLGQVVAVEVISRRLTIDFPIAGRYRLDADAAGHFLDYGYAVTESAASSPLRPLASVDPPVDVDPPGLLAEVIELELP